MTPNGPTSDSQHRQVQEMLGAHALGGLGGREQTAVQSHLDGCASCRAELAELAPLAAALRLVDPEQLSGTVSPSPDLGQRISRQVVGESALRDRRARRHRGVRLLTAAAAVVVLIVGTGAALQLQQGGSAPVVLAAGQEPIPLQAQRAGISVSSAVLVPHTWGLEVTMTMSGVRTGERYRAVAVDRAGRQMPAGEFLGVADRPVVCNMQAALRRPDATAFLILDAQGQTVAQADLTA